MNKSMRFCLRSFVVLTCVFLVSSCANQSTRETRRAYHYAGSYGTTTPQDATVPITHLWAMDYHADAPNDCLGNLWRINPAQNTGQLICTLAGVGGQDGWVTVAEAADGTLYFAHANNSPNSIYKLAPNDIPATWETITPTSTPRHLVRVMDPMMYKGTQVNPNIVGLTFGPDGNLYFAAMTSDGDHNTIDSALYRVNIVDSFGHPLTTSTIDCVFDFQNPVHHGGADDGKSIFRGGIAFHPGTKALYAVVKDPTGKRCIVTIDWNLIDPALHTSMQHLNFATQTHLFWDLATMPGSQVGLAFTPDKNNPTLYVSGYTFGIFRYDGPNMPLVNVFDGLHDPKLTVCGTGQNVVNIAADVSWPPVPRPPSVPSGDCDKERQQLDDWRKILTGMERTYNNSGRIDHLLETSIANLKTSISNLLKEMAQDGCAPNGGTPLDHFVDAP